MLYSIPGRCGIEISVETISRLAKDCPHIVCVKEAGGNVDRVNQLMQVVPENFTVLCGDDGLTVPFMACGASGLVSVTSNLVPGIMNSIVKAGLNQDMGEMLSLQKTFYPLMKGLMTLDSNPVPIKAALAMRGDIQPGIRRLLRTLPVCRLCCTAFRGVAGLKSVWKQSAVWRRIARILFV